VPQAAGDDDPAEFERRDIADPPLNVCPTPEVLSTPLFPEREPDNITAG
jgi:hypothetical protein